MAKKLGTAVLVKVSATASGHVTVEHQQGGTLTRASSPADVTNKDSAQDAEQINGIFNWEVSFSGVHDETKTGQEIMRDRWENKANVFVELVETGGAKTHSGQGQVTDWSLDIPHDGAVTYSGTIQGSGGLTTT